jgi:hypothetical protein
MGFRLSPASGFLLCMLLACGGGTITGDDDDVSMDDDDSTTGDDDTTTGDDDTTTGDDDTTTGDDDTTTGDDDDTLDCENLPQGPLPYEVIHGPRATEDLAFDDEGYLIGADSGNLFRSLYAAASELWVPGPWADITGLRALPSGDIVYADTSDGSLMRVDRTTGARTTVLSGLSNPDGLEIDMDGFVYVAEQASGMVRRVDPDTGEFIILATDLNQPNGLSFDPSYTTLYVDSYGGGVVYAIPVGPDGTPGEVWNFAGLVGTGLHDGMGVDACGNVYICDYGMTTVMRISPDGLTIEPVVDLGPDSTWIPNLQWGSGVGGWDEMSIYVNDIEPLYTYEVPVGVPSKPRSYP